MISPHLSRFVLAAGGLVVTLRFMFILRRERECGERGSCSLVMETPQGSVLGIRNTTAGAFYFGVLVGFEALWVLGSLSSPTIAMLAQSAVWLGAMGSFYLLYQLVAVLKMRCALCVAAHLCNIVLAATYIV